MLVACSSSCMTLCISSLSNALSKLNPMGLYFLCFSYGGYCVFGVVSRSSGYFLSYLWLVCWCLLLFGFWCSFFSIFCVVF